MFNVTEIAPKIKNCAATLPCRTENKLRDERKKKQRRLRVQHFRQHALKERVVRRTRGVQIRALMPVPDHSVSQEDQIGGARIANGFKCDGRGRENRRQSERRCSYMHQPP